jgi:hypothetical protein
MSKATRKTTPKALKAKVTRRTTPKHKPTPCPVVELANKLSPLVKRFGELKREWNYSSSDEQRKEITAFCNALLDEATGLSEQMTHVQPKSIQGVAYLVMAAGSGSRWLHKVEDREFKQRCQRRIIRALYMALDYFADDRRHLGLDWEVRHWFMPHVENPIYQLEQAQKKPTD